MEARMNKAAVRRMIRRITEQPKTFDQAAFYVEPSACGTVACIAGDAVICSVRDEAKGIKLAEQLLDEGGLIERADRVLGLPSVHEVYRATASGWPKPYSDQYPVANSKSERAKVAAAYLSEAVKRGTMIW